MPVHTSRYAAMHSEIDHEWLDLSVASNHTRTFLFTVLINHHHIKFNIVQQPSLAHITVRKAASSLTNPADCVLP